MVGGNKSPKLVLGKQERFDIPATTTTIFHGQGDCVSFPPLKPEFADGKKITIMDCNQTYSEHKICVNGTELPS